MYNETLNYIIVILAFLNKEHISIEEFVSWYHKRFSDIGIYEFQNSLPLEKKYNSFINNLIIGRKNIYKNVNVIELKDSHKIISTDFICDTVYFDVMDVTINQFHFFAETLLRSHTNQLGFNIEYYTNKNTEEIIIYKDVVAHAINNNKR